MKAALYALIVFSLAFAIFDFYWAFRSEGGMVFYYGIFGVWMLFLLGWNVRTLLREYEFDRRYGR